VIIQTALPEEAHFVIEQVDHARSCGQLAEAFGNGLFAPPVPQALLSYIVAHHDEGWAEIDGLREQSPVTGLPHHLTQTPLPYLLQSSVASPEFNERYHPFCGLLSSMHTYGLFNGRYGLSDFIFIDKVPEALRQAADEMLAGELARQERLKGVLAQDETTAVFLPPPALFNNYKLLQFFDTLGLYFHTTCAAQRGELTFRNVPDGHGRDHDLTIQPQTDGSYQLSPWPFAGDSLEFSVVGRYLTPQPTGADFGQIFADTAKESQRYRLVAGER
jgi:hypothetical protein